MQEGRYKIVHKLGWRHDGTIWLARDTKLLRHVAIKVYISDRRHVDSDETSILRRLADGPANHAGKENVVELLDEFESEGPNGRHRCVVTEALGRVLNPATIFPNLPPGAVWEVAKQLVEAAAYMHSMGIAHGDIRLEKVMFARSSLFGGDAFADTMEYSIGEVETIDGSALTPQVPRYQIYPVISEVVAGDYRVKVTGFGRKFVDSAKRRTSKYYYRAPELVFGSPLGPSADIWSLGCTIFELVNEVPLLELLCEGKDDMVEELIGVFGDLPEEWKDHTPPRTADSPKSGEYGILNALQRDIRGVLPEEEWFSNPSINALGDMLVSMTQYRPSDRPSAVEVLQHPWFQSSPHILGGGGSMKEDGGT